MIKSDKEKLKIDPNWEDILVLLFLFN